MARARLKRLTRFGLKSLLLLMAIVALWCGYYASQVQSRQQALALVAERGGVYWQRANAANVNEGLLGRVADGYHKIVYGLFGNALRPSVSAVELIGAELSVDDLETLGTLAELQWLSLGGSTIDDSAIRALANFNEIRWLDLSGTHVTVEGLRAIRFLPKLEWLDVSNTGTTQEDLESLHAIFHDTQLGSEFSNDGFEPRNLRQIGEAPRRFDDAAESLVAVQTWQQFQENPFFKNYLRSHLAAIGRAYAIESPQWYIGGVYRAERPEQEPLLVVQIEQGTGPSSEPESLLVFEPDGDLTRKIWNASVLADLNGLVAQSNWSSAWTTLTNLRSDALQQKEVLDLPDLNGDGFDEIPTTQPYHAPVGAPGNGDTCLGIYTTSQDNVPPILRIVIPNATRRSTLIDLTGLNVGLAIRNWEERTLVLDTACYAATPAGNTLLPNLPRRTLARFVWSDEAGTFLGPAAGPDNTWYVLLRK